MTLRARDCYDRMQHALRGPFAPTVSEVRALNEVGILFYNMRAWHWRQSGAATLSLVKGQPFVWLPDDWGGEIAVDGFDTLNRHVTVVDERTFNRLRSYTYNVSSLQFVGTYSEVADKLTNLLVQSEDMDEAPWTTVGSAILSPDKAAPNGELTAFELDDNTAGTTGGLYQDVPRSHLVEGKRYVASVFVKNVDADVSRLILNWGPRALADFTWTAGVPSVTAKTGRDYDPTPITAGVVDDPILAALGWYRLWIAVPWAPVDYFPIDHLRFEIQPTSGAGSSGLGSMFVWGASMVEGEEPASYVRTEDVLPTRINGLRPRLELYPTPESNEPDFLLVRYMRRWSDVSDDDDLVCIPNFCEPFFLRMCEEYALGLHEENKGSLNARLDLLQDSMLYMDLIRQDVDMEPGRYMRNGEAQGITFGNYGTSRNHHIGDILPEPI